MVETLPTVTLSRRTLTETIRSRVVTLAFSEVVEAREVHGEVVIDAIELAESEQKIYHFKAAN